MKIAAIFLGLVLGTVGGGLLMGGSLGEGGASSGCACEDVGPNDIPAARVPIKTDKPLTVEEDVDS